MTAIPRTLTSLLLAGAMLTLTACGTMSSGRVVFAVDVDDTRDDDVRDHLRCCEEPRGQHHGSRAELAAGAALHKLPTTDYTGLVPKETYYAYNPATNTCWAGAGLVASKRSKQAQIGDQDDGAYLVFDRPAAGTWRAYDAGIPGDSHFTCSIAVPSGVLTVWHWTAGTCHPPAA